MKITKVSEDCIGPGMKKKFISELIFMKLTRENGDNIIYLICIHEAG